MLPTPKPTGVTVMGAVLPAIDIIFVVIRLYAKRRIRRYGIDDGLVVISLILTIGMGTIMIYGSVKDGFGRASPSNNSGFEEQDSILAFVKKLFWCFDIISVCALGTVKLSVIFFYRSIFRGRAFNIISSGMVCIVLSWSLVYFFTLTFQCGTQFTYLWGSAATIARYCIKGAPLALGFSVSDVLTDGFILAMPIYWAWKLKMSFWRKLSVCGVFLFGAITIVASIIRLAVYIIVYPHHNKRRNQIGVYSTIVYWVMLEMGLSIIAACLPTLAPIFHDASTEKLSQRMRSLLSFRPRSAGVTKSVSETEILGDVGTENKARLETIAMGNCASGHGEGEMMNEEMAGHIMVTKDLSRHSSTEVV